MTKNELLEFLKTDPVFKVADKQLVATLYESPFDNFVRDQETGSITITLHGESFTFTRDDADLAEVLNENPSLMLIMPAKQVIISAGFRQGDDSYYIAANNSDITEDSLILFTASADEGGGN